MMKDLERKFNWEPKQLLPVVEHCCPLSIGYLIKGFQSKGSTFGMQWSRSGELVLDIQATLRTPSPDGKTTPQLDKPRSVALLRVIDIDHGAAGETEEIELEWTECNYGGSRAWFICPMCRRRCGTIYDKWAFACRRCQGLTYLGNRRSRKQRLRKKIAALRRRLGSDLSEGIPERPRYMHRRTYQRLVRQLRAAIGGLSKRDPKYASPLRRMERSTSRLEKIFDYIYGKGKK